MSDFSIDYILNRAGDQYIGTNASMGIMRNMQVNGDIGAYMVNELRNFENCEEFQRPCAFKNTKNLENSEATNVSETNFVNIKMFDWLQYTRYHPPKLPRAFRPGPSKRTPGRLPRIPFSPAQLKALEDAYKVSNYLSAEDANRLAESLDLTNTRVKIWFQNRRARERREKREKIESAQEHEYSNASSSEEPEEVVVVV